MPKTTCLAAACLALALSVFAPGCGRGQPAPLSGQLPPAGEAAAQSAPASPIDRGDGSGPQLPQMSFSLEGQRLAVFFTAPNGRGLSLELTLPDGISAGLPQNSQLTAIALTRDGEETGALTLSDYGRSDGAALAAVDPSSPELPAQIYSPMIAFSDIADFHNGYRPAAFGDSFCSAVCHPVANGAVFDYILAYDLASEPYFLSVGFIPGVVTGEQLEAMAKSVSFSPRDKS